MPKKVLEKVKVSGFKSIRSLDLDLKALNILIGANGSGKSNFISVFKFLNQIINKNLQLFTARSGGVNSILHFGQKVTHQLDLYFLFGNQNVGNAYECTLIPTATENLIFAREWVDFHNRNEFKHPKREGLGRGHPETLLSPVESIQNYVIQEIKSWKVYHFHDTSDTAQIKQSTEIDDNRFLKPDASNLAAYLYLLHERQKPYYDNIVGTIQLIAPFFDDFELRPNPFDPTKIKLEWREKGSDSYFDANALSDGTLRFMSLATLLLQPADYMPSTILLDEPELGLHPYAIVVLADLLRSAATQAQVIISTQSVTLVNQFSPDDIIVVELIDGESIFKRLPQDEIETWLDDYGLGELWEKNVLGGRPTR